MTRKAPRAAAPKAPVVHAPAGLGFTYCGKKIAKPLLSSGDPAEVTCPSCRAGLEA